MTMNLGYYLESLGQSESMPFVKMKLSEEK